MSDGPNMTNRVTAAGLGGAVAVIGVWLLNLLAGIVPPAEVVVALTTVSTFGVSAAWSRWGGV